MSCLRGRERTLFRRLAVFVGGFTLRAAEAVCAGVGLSAAEVFSVLSHLVDKSLVAVSVRGDESRYAMLDTVRRYADGILQRSGETSSVRRKHAEYFMLFAETASDKLTGPEQPQWLRRLEAEHDNLRAAMTWGFEDDTSVAPAARIAVALREFWYAQGYLDEGRRWLETVAGRSASVADLWRARALTGAALLALMQEAYDEAVALVEEALTIDRRLDDKHEIVSSLIILSTVGMLGQRSDIAYVELLTEADTLKSALTDLRLVARLLDVEAAVALFVTRDVSKARRLWQQSLAISRHTGNQYGEADVASSLGLLATADPDHEQATALLEEALTVGLEAGLPTRHAILPDGAGEDSGGAGSAGSSGADVGRGGAHRRNLQHPPDPWASSDDRLRGRSGNGAITPGPDQLGDGLGRRPRLGPCRGRCLCLATRLRPPSPQRCRIPADSALARLRC